MARNLGFSTIIVSEATATFGRRDFTGRWHTSDEAHAMSLANLPAPVAFVEATPDRRQFGVVENVDGRANAGL